MNSSLVNYIKISPNSNPRNNKIQKITIHHMAGNLSVEQCGDAFLSPNAGASANYGIDSNGRVGMYVEEKNRAWTSFNAENDHQAITIEVANDEIGGNWHVSDKALNKLIELCVDICKRNDIKGLNYTGDASGNLTRHNMFVATDCPGPYLQSKFPWIAEQVNKKLNALEIRPLYRVRKSWDSAASQIGAFTDLENAKRMCDSYGSGYKVFDANGNVVYPVSSYKVKVQVSALNIRDGAGIQYKINGCITDFGVYTIVEEKNGFGKLLSGAGWICLDYTKRI